MRHFMFILAILFLASCQPAPKQDAPAVVPGTTTTTTSTTSTTTQDKQNNVTPAVAPGPQNSTSTTDTIKVKGTTTHEIKTYPTRKNDLSDTAAEIRKMP